MDDSGAKPELVYPKTPQNSSITAHFSDSSSATGTLLVGADGLHSRVRTALLSYAPHLAANQEFPPAFSASVSSIPPASR